MRVRTGMSQNQIFIEWISQEMLVEIMNRLIELAVLTLVTEDYDRVVIACSSVEAYQRFGGTYHMHF
jgi:hypothetical protein